jgi:hypothetical protein
MTTRIRTLTFLPEIFQTKTNAEFLSATLDQIVNPPVTQKIEGYVGSKIGYGVNAKDNYVTEPTKIRTDYQLDPGVVFTKKNSSVAQDFISYPGMLDAIKLQGGITEDNSRLFESEIYSWDSFTNLDKLINYNQYYWVPAGLPAVTVSSALVFSSNDYQVNDLANGYEIRELGSSAGTINPTITLLRGGTYRFIVNQASQFWIQSEPGTSGFSSSNTNVSVREIFGVENNGANQGVVTFSVPAKDAQNELIFPGDDQVGVVSTLPFSSVNGARLTDLGSIDGITSIEGLRVLFYNTGIPAEVGYISSYFDEGNYDSNINLVNPITVTISDTAGELLTVASGDTSALKINNAITFNSPAIGGLEIGVIYYISEIFNSTQFKISSEIGGASLSLSTDSGSMVANVNQGLYEEGFYTNVSENFYRVTFVGDPSNPVIRLLPDGPISNNQKITAQFGTQWINRQFYRNNLGVVTLIPLISADLDQLYYQDGTASNKVGLIRIIESNLTNTINVDLDIIGKKQYTSTNGVVFTNGLKVIFDGDVVPRTYLEGEYYVEGVGSSIQLVPVQDLISPERYTTSFLIPYDINPYDIGNYDGNSFVPGEPDYITIARNSISKNAWSRSNRWFHVDVINQTAIYNNTPDLVTQLLTSRNKAIRPIIEFYPNLKLFVTGTEGKNPVDFVDTRTTDALSDVAGLNRYFPDVEVYTNDAVAIAGVTGTSTTITIVTTDITGEFKIGQYVNDYLNILPRNTQIDDIQIAGDNTILTVSWQGNVSVASATDVAIVGSSISTDSYAIFPGARIVFAADEDVQVRNKIYVANISVVDPNQAPIITLVVAEDGDCFDNNQFVVLRGYNNRGKSFFLLNDSWIEAQEKLTINQPPLFDVFDKNGNSFGDSDFYPGTSFKGCKLFAYGIGTGPNDSVLGFPIRYSAIDNVGDISFDVSLNADTFDYVSITNPITQKVNTGYVFDFSSRTDYTRALGWQTAAAPSAQYQVFQFPYSSNNPTTTFECDIAAIPFVEGSDQWRSVQVYVNNACACQSQYSYTTTDNSTIIELNTAKIVEDTIIEILVLSKQTSKQAYYMIPANLNNNPLNGDLEQVNIGDIRAHYRDIYINTPGILGQVFGKNNYRDLGNLVPYGTKIIQNSASLALPGAFLRKSEHNLFDALMFNSREYVKFKALLVDTINNTDYQQRFAPTEILDQAMDVITAAKSEAQAFFWSDMLPNKAPLRSNTYTLKNDIENSIYPLTTVYDFEKANYNSVLVYLLRTVGGITRQQQLIRNQDYVVSTDASSLTVTLDLVKGDKIVVKEYNQTYGSFVPNTPTKLGLYPATVPQVVLDSAYQQPTYFIKGHDGSYNKLYGDYYPDLDVLEDFRDQGLLEFEKRIFNNLKLSSQVPIQLYDTVPGFFRDTEYTYNEFLQMYTENFLNWVGQNRLEYKTQFFNRTNEYTYNYTNSANKVDNTPIEQGYWRGVYQYFYDTTTPNSTPWEMLGFTDQPEWWQTRYGPAPYTSDNLILWGDLEAGLIWNDGDSYTVSALARPGLSKIIPVNSAGELITPFVSLVGNYNPNTFQKDWKVGDVAPVELSYRRSSSYPFDLMKLNALMKPAKFFNLGADSDNYKYNTEFNQWLVNDRSHLVISDIEIYGTGTAKTSYINWIVDFEKQVGITATENITDLLDSVDVRLVYRLAGYSDKDLLKFYVEKGTPNSKNASLLIPDESYSVLLYDNQPFDRIVYSAVVVQITNDGYSVFGNSQTNAYFKTLKPLQNGNNISVQVENATVKIAREYTTEQVLVPYGTKFYSQQEVAQFIASYGAYLQSQGMVFDELVSGFEINWNLMVEEFLYWAQTGWQVGNIVSLNPSAQILKINKESAVVQPLTVQQTNFVLNQNLYPIQTKDMSVSRDGTAFSVTALNQGDSISYGQFNISNFEHGIVFNNITLFNDVIYNLVTGLRQSRLNLRGTRTAEWNGTINASGFIMNQDNVQEWSRIRKYTKGEIVLFKNRYWTALRVIEPTATFTEKDWKETNYDAIQKGLLPNPSTRSFESTLYYDTNRANLEKDSDVLGFSLIGYRPRDYLALADLTDITQVNVYKNLIKNKGTRNAVEAFKGANLPQGGIDYEVYENWAIKTSEYGGTLNKNFVDFKLNEELLTSNPTIVSLFDGEPVIGSQQDVSIFNLFNYAKPIDSPNILSTINTNTPTKIYPDAGYVNFNDVKMSSYFYSGLSEAVNENDDLVSIKDFYVRDYAWLANYFERWDVLTWKSLGEVVAVRNNPNNTATITFSKPHNLKRNNPIAIVNYATSVDGYYLVNNVVNLNEVIINLPNTTLPTTGRGIGLTFQSQRVAQPSDINSLPLIDSEFTKNTVWVDSNTDGSWAVYRKSLNYQFDNEFFRTDSTTFGTQVAYTKQSDYLISDAPLGKVYRYRKTATSGQYFAYETVTNDPTFGSRIAYADSTYFISETSGKVYVYVINDSTLSDNFLLCQEIDAPLGVTNWGSDIAVSGDSNWLYISDIDNNKVHVYQKQNIILDAGYFVIGETYEIIEIGNDQSDWLLVGAIEGEVGITFVATGAGTGTGKARQISYKLAAEIDGTVLGLVAGDNFSKSLTTDYYGDTLVVGAPNKDFSVDLENWGSAYAFARLVQNIEVQFSSTLAQNFQLAWTPEQPATRTGTGINSNYITASGSMTGFAINDPVIFTGTLLSTGISPNTVYYIADISGSTFTIKESRSVVTPVTLTNGTGFSFNIHVQVSPMIVSVNGKFIQDDSYGYYGNTFVYTKNLLVGDILTISGSEFSLQQTFTSKFTDRVGAQFGYAVDTTKYGTEILVGSPFEISENNQEGAVYRFTNSGGKFGIVIGTQECQTTATRELLINGYLVSIPAGNATIAANTINEAKITNVQAAASFDNKLIIQVINKDLTLPNEELIIAAADTVTLTELGVEVYAETQVITAPHKDGPTQFGTVIKFNEHDSVVISAPVATRFSATTFDFTDDENQDNDTVFDNNATQFVDTAPNAGAVYMFDYIANSNESLNNTGKFIYAQSINDRSLKYGFNPLYGQSIDFNDNKVIIGSPNFLPESIDGKVTVYENLIGVKDWQVFRSSSEIVDIEGIQNSQLYSARTNDTLVNLDYIDPLQGKLLGSVRQNIDYVSSIDPASYRNDEQLEIQSGFVWGERNVGELWFDTTNVRFVNYHQNDVVYNSKHWGTVFTGSDVAIYTWVESIVQPIDYSGPGTPKDISQFTISTKIDASDIAVPVYYFWVRNTNTIVKHRGKTLSDSILESYIRNPRKSGISFVAPLLSNAFALYNSEEYINDTDTVFQIGYATGTNDDAAHTEFTLIRENFADDFLPGIPRRGVAAEPQGLYDRFLDSLAGVDESGAIVPNPFLPKALQSGILARPRQSFFNSRFQALRNYLTYANTVLSQFPVSEIRKDVSFLFAENPPIYDEDGTTLIFEQGQKYNTVNYWQYTNWWASGYDDNTKSAIQVPLFADLFTLNVAENTIVTVETNGEGKFEVYRYDDNSIWTRIGLENGTIKFDVALWDYAAANIGFGDNFFDVSTYDQYPSEETRYIIRALNEQIYINELATFRNKSLILLFEFIQSETTESQNYLPWLSKTSLADVFHTIRELRPIENFQADNQDFLEGYINEVKPYHVVIKEFLFKYTGSEIYDGTFTDFDLPAQYNERIQQFVSPRLVTENPNEFGEYLPTNDIWQNDPYAQWFQNRGVKLASQPNYEITVLASYMTVGSTFMIVDNAQGFPINGVITIGNEQIAYSQVDRATNIVSGLTRGFNNTQNENHLPGEKITIDLPEVVVLDSGKGYTNPPRVTAYIDLEKYSAPIKEAELEAVMGLDSVLSIRVIDPGQGYAVLPEIRIEPSIIITFSNTDINSQLHTIKLFAPNLLTGDLIRFSSGADGIGIGKLANNQWYYINVLENTPTTIIALYTNYSDAINDRNRIQITDIGNTTVLALNVGAKASAITSASPVRENNITLRFDRTTYTSQVQDWRRDVYYGSFFAGRYYNSERISSSSISLQSTLPSISQILASARGAVFEIAQIENDRQLTWSTVERRVAGTFDTSNTIRLVPLDDGSVNPNASGSTVGFYTGLPIKFVGSVVGGLIENQEYFVLDIINDTDFTVSETVDGSVFVLSTATTPISGLSCFTGNLVNTAVLTFNYPGILTATATQSGTNAITVPNTLIGTGGTTSFYTNLPVFFTGEIFDKNIQVNEVYYVTTVIDDQTFTISETQDPVMLTAISASANVITLDSTAGLEVNDPVIFTDIEIEGSSSSTFGNIVAGTTYYISEKISATEITISTAINGTVFTTGTVTQANNTSARVTSQAKTLKLTTASGAMIVNVSLPVSPGQIDGQKFTLYETSQQYPDITGTNGNLITRSLNATIDTVDRIAFSRSNLLFEGTNNFYVNMPIRFGNAPAGSGLDDITTYFITDFGEIEITVTSTSSSGNEITCDTTESLYVGMPIVFSGNGIGNIVISVEYFIDTIVGETNFTIKDIDNNPVILTNDSGIMIGTGDLFITVSTTKGGSSVTLVSTIDEFTMTQEIISDAEFDISFVLGGYQALVSAAGEGYAIDNTISIPGNLIGGSTPINDLTLTVNTIDEDGNIIDVICSGIVPGASNEYYLKVISDTQLEVYSDPLLKMPVSGLDLPYVGFTTVLATAINAGDDRITVTSSDDFEINDPVVFTGSVFTTEIYANRTYYIYDKPTTTTVRITTNPGSLPIEFTTSVTGSMNMTKAGSFALLPEPFYFNQSIVKFNNRVYVCVVSNNDDEFVFGKWELLDSGDRRLNAMDRVVGYYQPTANMPGIDLTQLFEGVTYPDNIYVGNPFAPGDQYELDTVLKTQPFYPTEIDISAVVWDGENYLAVANTPRNTVTLGSSTGNAWAVANLTNSNISATDIIEQDGVYLITSSNSATPVFRSNDGITWSSTGFVQSETGSQPINISAISLNSVEYNNGIYIAVGSGIVSSNDTYTWTKRVEFFGIYENRLFGITSVTLPNFSGFVAVGAGQMPDYSTGLTETVDTNLVYVSSNGINWNQIDSLTDKGFYCVAANDTVVVALGKDGVVYYSNDTINWKGASESLAFSINTSEDTVNVLNTDGFVVNDVVRFNNSFSSITTGTDYYIVDILSSSQIQISETLAGPVLSLTNDTVPTRTFMTKHPATDTLRDVVYNDNTFIAVGDNGTVQLSSNGINWTPSASPSNENLKGVSYQQDSTFIAVGDNNTVIISDDNGITWRKSEIFVVAPPVYEIKGGEFLDGYAPEELVAGVVKDNLTLIVNTRPGTNWPVDEYAHTGYNIVSLELEPEFATQDTFSFDKAAQYPTELSIFKIDGISKLSTSLYEGIDYTVDWITNTITLAQLLPDLPVSDVLRIDVYEVGNGDQLVKSNTKTDPIRLNTNTGYNEIELSCNYSELIYQGSGAIRPLTFSTSVFATETDSISNSISCDSVENFVVNGSISFSGLVFGGIVENQQYFVKSISYATNSITISESFIVATGIAGPIFELSSDSGLMLVNIQSGPGLVWSDPAIYHNGVKLVLGTSNIVVGTNGNNNTVISSSAGSLIVGTPIVFCQCAFPESGIDPLTTYFVHSIVNSTEFRISDTQNGPAKDLITATGRSLYITNDFAIRRSDNNISAKLVFANPAGYSNDVDYIAYTIFGQTFPEQYGYTLPETELFVGDGVEDTFVLSNFAGGDNPSNAIVEINGIRINPSAYSISSAFNIIEFATAPNMNDVIAVTMFNDTNRQYLNTQVEIIDSSTIVSEIINISNTITPVLAATSATASTAGSPNEITVTSTDGFVEDQTVQFKGTSFDTNIATDGTVYFVDSVIDNVTFTIKDRNGIQVITNGGTGNMIVEVGGTPTVRVTTETPHLLAENDLVRIDDTLGSIQLNNNTYYAKVIDNTRFDLYSMAYDPITGAVNFPITVISSYEGGGYVWQSGAFVVNNVWDLFNADRIWVTINGYRVPSSKLKLNENNQLSILNELIIGDEIIITSMIPSATPDEETYFNFVDNEGNASVYRANTGTKTWLTESIYDLSSEIFVDDVTRLTNFIVQTETVSTVGIDGKYEIGLNADKRIITNVTIFNETTQQLIASSNYQVIVEELSPLVKITPGVYINENDVLTVTILEGNLIYVNGEQIRFGSVDFVNNSLGNLTRGVNGTAKQVVINKYTEVYGLLSKDRLSDVFYNQTWNSEVFNTTLGDPLQISNTVPAEFLNSDII